MALQCDPNHLGDIGDREPEPEPDPDRIYEQEMERRIEEALQGRLRQVSGRLPQPRSNGR